MVVGVLELGILDVDDVDDAVVDDIRVATAVATVPSKAVATIKRGWSELRVVPIKVEWPAE